MSATTGWSGRRLHRWVCKRGVAIHVSGSPAPVGAKKVESRSGGSWGVRLPEDWNMSHSVEVHRHPTDARCTAVDIRISGYDDAKAYENMCPAVIRKVI